MCYGQNISKSMLYGIWLIHPMGIQIQTSQGFFIDDHPLWGGSIIPTPAASAGEFPVSREYPNSAASSSKIASSWPYLMANHVLLNAGHGWILSDATVFQVLK